MIYRDPELDALMAAMIDHVARCDAVGMGHWARPMQEAVAVLKSKHPYFEEPKT